MLAWLQYDHQCMVPTSRTSNAIHHLQLRPGGRWYVVGRIARRDLDQFGRTPGADRMAMGISRQCTVLRRHTYMLIS